MICTNVRVHFNRLACIPALATATLLWGADAQAAILDFEAPTYSLSDTTDTEDVINPLAGQDGWDGSGSTPEDAVVATVNSGLYVGGQAAGHIDSGGSENLGRLGQSPAVGNMMRADFFGGDSAYPGLFDDGDNDADTNLRINGWIDADNDGNYDSGSSQGERSFQFGLDATGVFNIEYADGSDEVGGSSYAADTWYRITASWVDNVGGGKDVTLSVFDLTNNSDLGIVLAATLSNAEFGPDPSEYDGIGFRGTRGLLDNILVVPEPSSVLLLSLAVVGISGRRVFSRM